jgi:hypothetical protein
MDCNQKFFLLPQRAIPLRNLLRLITSNEKVKGMQVHIKEDSMFMIKDDHIIDKGRIEGVSDHDIQIRMPNKIVNTIIYEYGATNKELILTLPDGVKLYMDKID